MKVTQQMVFLSAKDGRFTDKETGEIIQFRKITLGDKPENPGEGEYGFSITEMNCSPDAMEFIKVNEAKLFGKAVKVDIEIIQRGKFTKFEVLSVSPL